MDVVTLQQANTSAKKMSDSRRRYFGEAKGVRSVYLGTVTAFEAAGGLLLPLCARAPFALKVDSLDLLVCSPIPASSTNYWTFLLSRQYASAEPPNVGLIVSAQTIMNGSTSSGNGEVDWPALVPYPMSHHAWDTTKGTLGADDVLTLTITPTGAPPPLDRLTVDWAYSEVTS